MKVKTERKKTSWDTGRQYRREWMRLKKASKKDLNGTRRDGKKNGKGATIYTRSL